MPRKKAAATPEASDVMENVEGMENTDSNSNPADAENTNHEGIPSENGLFGENGISGESDSQDNASESDAESCDVSVEVFDEADFADDEDSDFHNGADESHYAADAADNDDVSGFAGTNVENPDDAFSENGEAEVGINTAGTTSEASDSGTASGQPVSPARQRRRRAQTEPPASVLTLEVGGEVVTQKDKEDAIWHEIKNSQVSGTHLTGTLGKVERLENGAIISIIDYKGQRIAIPLREMMISLNRPAGQSDDEYNERMARVLNRMMGAEIDFVVRGITGTGEARAAVASRKAAMLRMRRRYYLNAGTNGKPMVYPDRVVEARIIAVSQMAIRVEIFGVETSIRNRDLSWGYMGDARDKFYVGDSVQVRVTSVDGTTPEDIRIRADIKSLTSDDTRDKLMALKPQTNCMGKVTDVRQGVIFISLVDGVRAISHKCFDHRSPGRGDDVLFVVTRIDEDGGVALGIVSRIVKRNI